MSVSALFTFLASVEDSDDCSSSLGTKRSQNEDIHAFNPPKAQIMLVWDNFDKI